MTKLTNDDKAEIHRLVDTMRDPSVSKIARKINRGYGSVVWYMMTHGLLERPLPTTARELSDPPDAFLIDGEVDLVALAAAVDAARFKVPAEPLKESEIVEGSYWVKDKQYPWHTRVMCVVSEPGGHSYGLPWKDDHCNFEDYTFICRIPEPTS